MDNHKEFLIEQRRKELENRGKVIDNLEHIVTGLLIERNGEYFSVINGTRLWSDNVDNALIHGDGCTLEDVKRLGSLCDHMPFDNATLIPVKKVTQYQIGEF